MRITSIYVVLNETHNHQPPYLPTKTSFRPFIVFSTQKKIMTMIRCTRHIHPIQPVTFTLQKNIRRSTDHHTHVRV